MEELIMIIMRGIPGSGKSTEAKKIVGNGIIHSTDDLIEATGDYNGYFKKMIESGDWSEHGRMHNRNYKNALKSMTDKISPVIIDNTNIKASEPKKYVEAALKLGYKVEVVDVGTGGCTAEELAERNTHNVPLETIKRMMASHKGVGELTVKKILESKGMGKSNTITMLELNDKSKAELLLRTMEFIPEGWKVIAHHMTIKFGKPLDKDDKRRHSLNSVKKLVVTHLGTSDKAIAVKVTGFPSDNDIPHITLAVNPVGGKPVMSNDITKWDKIAEEFVVSGTIVERPL